MRKIYEQKTFDTSRKPQKNFRQFTPKPFLIVLEGGLSEIRKRAADASLMRKAAQIRNHNDIITQFNPYHKGDDA